MIGALLTVVGALILLALAVGACSFGWQVGGFLADNWKVDARRRRRARAARRSWA